MNIRASLKQVLHVASPIAMQHATNTPDTATRSATGDATTCLKASIDKELYATNCATVRQISAIDQAAIVAWLNSIGEHDPACIAEVLEQCRADTEALAYYLLRTRGES